MVQFSQGLSFERCHLLARAFEVFEENAEVALPIVGLSRICGLALNGAEGALQARQCFFLKLLQLILQLLMLGRGW